MATENSRGSAAIVRVRGLHYRAGGREIFAGADLDFPRGAVTAVMGPSGSGKTTLLRLITGQARPDRGSVEFDGMEVAALPREALYRMRRRMGMLFQNGALLTDLDVYENIAFPLREHTRLPERLVRHLVLTKLQAVGLRGAARLMPAELSGGMGRRVALARAIVMDPELLIYDEPFVGLDPISLGVVLRLIRRLWRSYDIAVSTQSGDRPTVFAFAAGRRRVGVTTDTDPWLARMLKRVALHRAVAAAEKLHRVEQILPLHLARVQHGRAPFGREIRVGGEALAKVVFERAVDALERQPQQVGVVAGLGEALQAKLKLLGGAVHGRVPRALAERVRVP